MTPRPSAVALADSPAPVVPAPPATDAHALGESIAALAVRLHVATYELLVLLREFDARKGWNNGCLSCAHWLHWRTSIDLGASREKVRVARALPALPRVSAEMQRGRLSYAKVRALTRVATPDNEQALVDFALCGTAAQVERFVRGYRRVDAASDRATDEARHLARVAEEVNHAQRRADALGLIAETAVSASLDAGNAGDRYQVVVHVSADTSNGSGRDAAIEVDHGALHVSAETSRRLACDASVVRIDHDASGGGLDVRRKTRTIPPSIRRALAARDSGCQFPGCTSRRCDAHHIEHWADGGATSVDNLVLLCRRHHSAVHEGGFVVHRAGDLEFDFIAPGGIPIPSRPPAHVSAETLPPLPTVGLDPPVWDGTPFDLVWAIDVLYSRSVLPERRLEEEEGCGSCGNRSLVSKELVVASPA